MRSLKPNQSVSEIVKADNPAWVSSRSEERLLPDGNDLCFTLRQVVQTTEFLRGSPFFCHAGWQACLRVIQWIGR